MKRSRMVEPGRGPVLVIVRWAVGEDERGEEELVGVGVEAMVRAEREKFV
jgi:hypothetical protein